MPDVALDLRNPGQPGAGFATGQGAGHCGRKARGQDAISGCHQVGLEAHGRPGLAPSFAKIARTKGMTRTAIETFLTPHEVMPNYVLDPRQIRDVAAYIESLRGTASGT